MQCPCLMRCMWQARCTPLTSCPQGIHLSMWLPSFGVVPFTHHLARAQSHQRRRQKGRCSGAKKMTGQQEVQTLPSFSRMHPTAGLGCVFPSPLRA